MRFATRAALAGGSLALSLPCLRQDRSPATLAAPVALRPLAASHAGASMGAGLEAGRRLERGACLLFSVCLKPGPAGAGPRRSQSKQSGVTGAKAHAPGSGRHGAGGRPALLSLEGKAPLHLEGGSQRVW